MKRKKLTIEILKHVYDQASLWQGGTNNVSEYLRHFLASSSFSAVSNNLTLAFEKSSVLGTIHC